MRSFGYLYLRWLLFALCFVVTIPFIIGLYWLWRLFIDLESLEFLLAFPVILWLLGVNWFAAEMANNVAFESMSLGDAFTTACTDMRFFLSFVPLIGRFFVSGAKQQK